MLAFPELCPFSPTASPPRIFWISIGIHSSRFMAHHTITVTIISDSALELGAMTGLF